MGNIEEKDGEAVLRNIQDSEEGPGDTQVRGTCREEQTQGLYGTAMEQPWGEEDGNTEVSGEENSNGDSNSGEIQTQGKIGVGKRPRAEVRGLKNIPRPQPNELMDQQQ